MQQSWANDPDFVQPRTGEDPVIGQSHSKFTPGQWPSPWGSPTRTVFDFHGYVKLQGGEYFFCPSIPFLRSLAE